MTEQAIERYLEIYRDRLISDILLNGLFELLLILQYELYSASSTKYCPRSISRYDMQSYVNWVA